MEIAVIDAVIGIVVCIISMYLFSGFKLELVILIPYLIKLFKIKDKWKAGFAGPGVQYQPVVKTDDLHY